MKSNELLVHDTHERNDQTQCQVHDVAVPHKKSTEDVPTEGARGTRVHAGQGVVREVGDVTCHDLRGLQQGHRSCQKVRHEQVVTKPDEEGQKYFRADVRCVHAEKPLIHHALEALSPHGVPKDPQEVASGPQMEEDEAERP